MRKVHVCGLPICSFKVYGLDNIFVDMRNINVGGFVNMRNINVGSFVEMRRCNVGGFVDRRRCNSLDLWGRRGDLRAEEAVFCRHAYLSEADLTSSYIAIPVHSLMLSHQAFFCRPRLRLPSTVPWRIVLERLSCLVTCPNQASFRRFTVASKDPCYGRKTEGSVPSPVALREDKGNPCRHLKDRTCKWLPYENRDLESLRRNRFNITCECHKDRRGFRWSSRFKLCVDVDECTEKDVKCKANRICQNSVGSFACVCRMGTQYDEKKQLCVEHVPLPAHNYHRSSRVRAVKQKTALRRFLEYIFGLREDTTPK
ncbi:nidogen-2 [Elysia marginata]|uniref:Nidogen-2 n=1 Tax=Elysia marginata TaxID=1093978 RepID=A0AAV4EQI4_9GAST|nr:nidogen-2 [Elysia marginata]